MRGGAARTLPRGCGGALPGRSVAGRTGGPAADLLGRTKETPPAGAGAPAGLPATQTVSGGRTPMTDQPDHPGAVPDADEVAARWLEGLPQQGDTEPLDLDEAGRRRLADLQLLHA